MSSFILKMIAIISMFIDHIGYIILGKFSYFNYIGRLAFPIFAFQISEGYSHTKNLKKYIIRLFIFALISQIPFMLFISIIHDDFSLNVIFTLLFGLIAIIAYDKCHKFFGIFICLVLGIAAEKLNCDYGFYGVVITFLFHTCNKNKLLLALGFIFSTSIYYAYNIGNYYKYGYEVFNYAFEYYLPYALCTLASIILIVSYNKKKGPDTRHLLYLFYPLHMLLIYGINFVI